MNIQTDTVRILPGSVVSTVINGVPGTLGPVGTDGISGPTGPTGPTGLDPQGATGPTGFIGETGPTGIDGPTGAIGPTGDDGSVGDPGDITKLAIVPAFCGPVSLYCIESPQVFFEDFIEHEFYGSQSEVELCQVFLNITEQVGVLCWVCDKPTKATLEIINDRIKITVSSTDFYHFNITVYGFRKGFTFRRFQSHSESEMQRNNAFYRNAL